MSLAIEIAVESGLIKINLDLIKRAEARIVEIASASPSQAPELEAFFIVSISKIIDEIADVNLAFKRSEFEAERIKASIMLDLNEDGSKKASNADIRKSLVFMNKDYMMALDKVNQLEALLVWLKDKKECISKAYFGTKDIIAVNGSFNPGNNLIP